MDRKLTWNVAALTEGADHSPRVRTCWELSPISQFLQHGPGSSAIDSQGMNCSLQSHLSVLVIEQSQKRSSLIALADLQFRYDAIHLLEQFGEKGRLEVLSSAKLLFAND